MTAVAAAVALILLLPSPALADERAVSDPDDVVGTLDLRRVSLAKLGPTEPLTIWIETYDGWGPRTLVRNNNRMIVLFDTDGDGSRDFRARILRLKRKFVALIKGSGQSFEPLPVTKPNRRTVRLVIPGSIPVNPDGGPPGIRVLTRFIGAQGCDPASGSKPCIDRAPDGGAWL